MTAITFIHPDGRKDTVEARDGDSAMRTALNNGIEEIVAECGGQAMCATCHVYVADDWIGKLHPMSDEEDALLDGVAADRLPASRLSCQIAITPELAGLTLRLPPRQV